MRGAGTGRAGVHVEIEPFGPVSSAAADTGAVPGGAYLESDAPNGMVPTTRIGPRNTALIPTEAPLRLEGWNPVFAGVPTVVEVPGESGSMPWLKKQSVAGLAAYLWQAELSLDRLQANDIREFRDYCARNCRYTPDDVLAVLNRIASPSSGDGNAGSAHRALGMCCSALGGLLYPFGDVVCVPMSRLNRVRNALAGLVSLADDGSLRTPEQIGAVRTELAHAASLTRKGLRPRSRRDATHYVTHLNSAEHLHLRTVEEIAGEDWLDRLSGPGRRTTSRGRDPGCPVPPA